MNGQLIIINNQKYVLVSEEEYYRLMSAKKKNTGMPSIENPNLLKSKRVELGATMKEMSEMLGITQAQICRLENGQKPNAKTKKLIKNKLNVEL